VMLQQDLWGFCVVDLIPKRGNRLGPRVEP
jgi:hypothetical protein